MPELPEVETVRQTLRNFVLNHRIVDMDVLYDSIIEGNTIEFINAVRGQKIIEIKRKGKFLIFELENQSFISHLRMEGKYYYVPSDTPIEKHTHVLFHLDGNMDLRYHDTRKFGRIQLMDKFSNPLDKLGNEPFDLKGIDFYNSIHTSQLPIKTVLLDQSKIAGLGNIYVSEVLFRARIHPLVKASALSKNKCQLIIDKSIEVLNEAINQGGTTIHSFSSNGIHGLFTQQLQVYGKEGEPCLICAKPIKRKMINGRSSYYCSDCQKKIYKKSKKKE